MGMDAVAALAACGVQVNYKSAEKYVGSDELELLVLFPTGTAWEVRYNIDVR
jgi:hypothetical protein